ncbi:hypothetical protein T484DRAFT_2695305 [Baffinella frigidus]|nr:hypothetical protein T484DRAFT_2695305 [Cryptophyta sp. CCMP2293]
MPGPSPGDLESGGVHAAVPDDSGASRACEEEPAGAGFFEEDHNQRFTEEVAVEFAQWQYRPRTWIILNIVIGSAFVSFIAFDIAIAPYGEINPAFRKGMHVTGLLNAACCFLVAAVVRRIRPTLLKYETVVSVVPQTILMCLYLTMAAFADLRRVNHRYCPTLLISFDYDTGFPRRQCENTDPAATTRCVVESFDFTGLTCTSGTVNGVALLIASMFACIPVVKPMSPRAALMVVVAYVVATPAAGIAVGADAPLVVVHTFYVAMLGLSVAWLRSKGLKLSKRRFMARKNLKQRAERNRRLLGALIPRSVQIKMEETVSRGEPVTAWNLPHITMLCIKFTPSVSELSLDPATAQNAFELLDGLISALDAIVDSYGMYKYQHVNDTYLVSCPRGALPDIDEDEPYPAEYTIQMALLAFRIKEIVSTFYTHAGKRLSIQAGLNCGPAAGAVVGESRRFYCIYGA